MSRALATRLNLTERTQMKDKDELLITSNDITKHISIIPVNCFHFLNKVDVLDI